MSTPPLPPKNTHVTFTPTDTQKRADKQQQLRDSLQFEIGGKTYQIENVRQIVSGKNAKWQKMSREDLLKLTPPEKAQLVQEATKATQVFARIQGAESLENAHSFTLSFKQDRISKPHQLYQVHFKATKGAGKEQLDIDLNSYPEEDQKVIAAVTSSLGGAIGRVFATKKQGLIKLQEPEVSGPTAPLTTAIRPNPKVSNVPSMALAIATARNPEAAEEEVAEEGKKTYESFLTHMRGSEEFAQTMIGAYNKAYPKNQITTIDDYKTCLENQDPIAQFSMLMPAAGEKIIILVKENQAYQLAQHNIAPAEKDLTNARVIVYDPTNNTFSALIFETPEQQAALQALFSS